MPKQVAQTGRKRLALWSTKRLDPTARKNSANRRDSLCYALKWVERARDAAEDDGVPCAHLAHDRWVVSYAQTTSYFLQTFLWYHELFGGDHIPHGAGRL